MSSARDFTTGSPDDGTAWWIYQGTGRPADAEGTMALPVPPPWRSFDGGPVLDGPPEEGVDADRRLGPVNSDSPVAVDPQEVSTVNASLYLRRPLLVTGRPGTGKSSLAYRITRELRLGQVLRWPITSRSTLHDGLYEYDAIGRLQAAGARQAGLPDDGAGTDIGRYLRLGPLGTALLPYERPRVLLIDELDKSDVDLPNDLLNVFEEGEFEIPELARLVGAQPEVQVFTSDSGGTAVVRSGRVRCRAFPMVVITSNGERDFPPAFLRRCLTLQMRTPGIDQLAAMVSAHFGDRQPANIRDMIEAFMDRSEQTGGLAADQLLNAAHLATSGGFRPDSSWQQLMDILWRGLYGPE